MIHKSKEIIDDFIKAANKCGFNISEKDIEHEAQPAPHIPHPLRTGKSAVYVFSLKSEWPSAAEGNRVLKVGKVGSNSSPRFQSQHYNPNSSQSNLSATLLRSKILWDYLRIQSIDESNVGIWIKENLDRDNFYMSSEYNDLIGELEKYLKGRFGPVFEGS